MSEPATAVESIQRSADLLTATTANGRARAAALSANLIADRTPASLVSYKSTGHLLVIGEIKDSIPLIKRLPTEVRCTLLVYSNAHKFHASKSPSKNTKTGSKGPLHVGEIDGVSVVTGILTALHGSLGQFTVLVSGEEGDVNLAELVLRTHKAFDLVLDLTSPSHIGSEIPPFGYYAPGNDAAALERALREIPDMVGEFEKPKYFHYNPDICAHGASGIKGCQRCLEACPTLAITSIGDKISVDPYLCQGGGSCASACPTGAITYVYPSPGDLLDGVRTVLKYYRNESGRQPVVLFYDAGIGRQSFEHMAAQLPEYIIPFEVEEVGSLGMDTWLTTLAYGASAVRVLMTAAITPAVRQELENQAKYAGSILSGMGYASERLQLIQANDDFAPPVALIDPPQAEIKPANFAALNEKRTMIRMAVDHLYDQAPKRKPYTALPDGAPFGQIMVDRKGCTLCLSCVSVCPSSALTDGGELPQLNFTEWNCVQCGLCETACPEQVITRAARFVYDPDIRRTSRILNEDKVFCCVSCGKPFATQRLMDRMGEKLAGHWMFQTNDAKRRIQMCDDCRVKDMFMQAGGMDHVYKKP